MSLRADLVNFFADLHVHETSIFFDEPSRGPRFALCWKMIVNGLDVELAIEDGSRPQPDIFLYGGRILECSFDVQIMRQVVGELLVTDMELQLASFKNSANVS